LLLFYVRDKAPTAHVWDYLKNRCDHALCGHGYVAPLELGEIPRPRSVCRGCRTLVPRVEAKQWRAIAERTAADLSESRDDYDGLWTDYEQLWTAYQESLTHADNQRREIRRLQPGPPNKTPPKK